MLIWDTSQLLYGRNVRITPLFNQDIGNWDVSNVTNMTSTFGGASVFNQDIGNWDVSNVTTMAGMFTSASAFNQDISGWNMSSVTSISAMFENATTFNQDLSMWNVSNVTNMASTFMNASSFNQDLGNWDVSNVTTMGGLFNGMLNNCGLSQTNYENTIIGWDSLPTLQPNVTIGAVGMQYQIGSASDIARTNIITNYTWTFFGDTAVP